MKLVKYLLIIIGLVAGLIMSFLEFGPIDSLDDNFEPVVNLNYDIVIHILFPYGVVYAVFGAFCGLFLWLILLCAIWLIKVLKRELINN